MGLKALKAEVVDKTARPEDLEIICPYFRCATVGAPRLLLPKTAIVTWCFAPEGNEATKNLLAACAAAGGEAKVGPIPLPCTVFNRIQQQPQEVCHPPQEKEGQGPRTYQDLDHGGAADMRRPEGQGCVDHLRRSAQLGACQRGGQTCFHGHRQRGKGRSRISHQIFDYAKLLTQASRLLVQLAMRIPRQCCEQFAA